MLSPYWNRVGGALRYTQAYQTPTTAPQRKGRELCSLFKLRPIRKTQSSERSLLPQASTLLLKVSQGKGVTRSSGPEPCPHQGA